MQACVIYAILHKHIFVKVKLYNLYANVKQPVHCKVKESSKRFLDFPI